MSVPEALAKIMDDVKNLQQEVKQLGISRNPTGGR